MGIFQVATRPPMHVELFMVQPRPVNGSLQTIVCQSDVKITLADGTVTQHCQYQVDQIHRLKVNAYHIPMGIPCILVCVAAVIFALMTSKENEASGLMSSSADLLFIVETYSMEMKNSYSKNTLYRWECIFWAFTSWTHFVVILILASPVDVFDCIVIVSFQILCIMYLCRPRQCDSQEDAYGFGTSISRNHHGGSGILQGFMVVLLLFIAWDSFASIPHVYEGERIWALAVLIVMDTLLLVIHLYDHVPTMYTIGMGRLFYVIVLSACVVGMFCTFKHRLTKYSDGTGLV